MILPQASRQNARKRAESIKRNKAWLAQLPPQFTAQEAIATLKPQPLNLYDMLRVAESQGLLKSSGFRKTKLYFKLPPKEQV
jgi:hypothetical protein